MSYTINQTNGNIFEVVADGTQPAKSGITLVGKNSTSYGEIINENLVKMIEHFSNDTAPSNPLLGQLWFDSSEGILKVYTTAGFKTIGSATNSATAPTGSVNGDMWWDSANGQLKVYNGTDFTTIGPAYTAGDGVSGAIVESITGTPVAGGSPASYVVVNMYVSDTVIAMYSTHAAFTSSKIPGFSTVNPGININTTVTNAKLSGTADSAFNVTDSTGNVVSVDDLLSAITSAELPENSSFVGNVYLDNAVMYNTGDNFVIANETADGDILLKVSPSGSLTNSITIDGATADVTINTDLAVSGNAAVTGLATFGSTVTVAGAVVANNNLNVAINATVGGTLTVGNNASVNGNVSLKGITNTNSAGIGNIGSASVPFATVYAQATSAQYADLAERFASDGKYSEGTVVELGGEAEVTSVVDDLSERVFGVVSHKAAYIMNDGAGNNDSHPAIAMAGRVPVQVVGVIERGDRLVSAGNGKARAATRDEANAFNVIGRALESKTSTGEGVIEAVVIVN